MSVLMLIFLITIFAIWLYQRDDKVLLQGPTRHYHLPASAPTSGTKFKPKQKAPPTPIPKPQQATIAKTKKQEKLNNPPPSSAPSPTKFQSPKEEHVEFKKLNQTPKPVRRQNTGYVHAPPGGYDDDEDEDDDAVIEEIESLPPVEKPPKNVKKEILPPAEKPPKDVKMEMRKDVKPPIQDTKYASKTMQPILSPKISGLYKDVYSRPSDFDVDEKPLSERHKTHSFDSKVVKFNNQVIEGVIYDNEDDISYDEY